MSQEIASMDLDGAALTRALQLATAGEEELGEYLAEQAGDDFGADELTRVLEAAAGDEEAGDDFGEDFGNDELSRLIEAASGASSSKVRRLGQQLQKYRAAARRVLPSRRVPVAPAASRGGQPMTPAQRNLALALRRVGPGEGPYTHIPFTDGTGRVIAAAGTQQFTLNPPKDVIILGMLLPADMAPRIVVDSILAEGDPLFSNAGAILGDCFRPDSTMNKLPRRPVRGGRTIIVTLRNISAADLTLIGASMFVDEGEIKDRAA